MYPGAFVSQSRQFQPRAAPGAPPSRRLTASKRHGCGFFFTRGAVGRAAARPRLTEPHNCRLTDLADGSRGEPPRRRRSAWLISPPAHGRAFVLLRRLTFKAPHESAPRPPRLPPRVSGVDKRLSSPPRNAPKPPMTHCWKYFARLTPRTFAFLIAVVLAGIPAARSRAVEAPTPTPTPATNSIAWDKEKKFWSFQPPVSAARPFFYYPTVV